MNKDLDLHETIEGKEKYYNEERFLDKLKAVGMKLGFKALYGAALLYSALKSPTMPMKNKLIIVGALGYLILPLDVMADFLPVFGLTDDAVIILKAVMTVYGAITDDIKEDAHKLLKNTFGDKYQYDENLLEMD